MFVFVGFVEELMFRAIVQTELEEIFGKIAGLLIASAIFGIMHIGSFVFMFVSGIVIGYVFQRTKHLMLTTIIHGTACVFAHGLLPMGIGLPTFLAGLS
jgi:membrane protease YdiL (CAAX protease family)